MSYRGLLPTGDDAPVVVPTLPATPPKRVSNFSDWATPLTKAGLSPTECQVAIPFVTQMPMEMDVDQPAFAVWVKAIKGALKTRGIPVSDGSAFSDADEKVLENQFNADWSETITWGGLLLGALSAPVYLGPGADYVSVAKANIPLIIGGLVVAWLLFKE